MFGIAIMILLIGMYFCFKGIYLTQIQIRMLHEEGTWIREHIPSMVASGYLSLVRTGEELEQKTFLRKKDLDRQFIDCLLYPWAGFRTKPLEEYYQLEKITK